MKKVLTVFITAIATLAISTVCLAQTAGPEGQTGTLDTAQVKTHKPGAYNEKVMSAALAQILPTLNLTPDQQSKIDTLNGQTRDQLKQIRKDTKGDKVARRDKMIALGQDFHKQLFGILDPAQTKQFKQEYKDFMKKWHEDHKKPATTTTPATTSPTTPTAPATTGGGN